MLKGIIGVIDRGAMFHGGKVMVFLPSFRGEGLLMNFCRAVLVGLLQYGFPSAGVRTSSCYSSVLEEGLYSKGVGPLFLLLGIFPP